MLKRYSCIVLTAALLWSCSSSPKSPSEPTLGQASPPAEGEESAATPTAEAPPTPEEAKAWVAQLDKDLRRLWVAQAKAEWDKSTNITDATEKRAAAASEASMGFLTSAIKESRRFYPILDQLDEDTRRQLMLLRIAGTPAPDDPAHSKELALISSKMEGIYGKGKVCDKDGKNCKDLGALTDILAKSRDPKELLAVWTGWRAVGTEIGPLYKRFVELANEGARAVGFADTGEMWRSGYDMPPEAFAAETQRLWLEVKPLYDQLHCYVRRQMVKKYGKKVVDPKGPVPAHLFGNMWAQQWNYIYPLVEPYRGQASPDVTKELQRQGYDHTKMVKLAENFFTSLGLVPLPDTFWERSMFVKPKDREVVCHASAWDVEMNNDLRIKMCIKTNQEDLITIHHELGHNYYFTYYYTEPVLYQNGAHDGFHEAIGDAIALSITPKYLKQVGLLKKVSTNKRALINQQMFTALEKIAFLPWGLLVDKWRWDVFSGQVTPDQYNSHWWELRRKYQGVVPPVERADDAFDPGAKYHIPGNTPYMRYFLAFILQFQFHKALCEASGHTGPLHECSIYGSKEAGDRFKAMMQMGASKPWPEAMEALTGTRQMSAAPLIEYFAPLMGWLEKQNKGQSSGW